MKNFEHFAEENISRVRQRLLLLADAMPSVWQELSTHGFALPELIVSEIDKIRERDKGEQSYWQCFHERLKENLGWYGMNISRATQYWERRDMSEYHSPYLNWLQDQQDAGEYPFVGKFSSLLDPNHMLYEGLGFREGIDKLLSIIDGYKVQKRLEVQHLHSEIQCLGVPPAKISPTRIFKLLNDIFSPLGFEALVSDVRKGYFIFKRDMGDKAVLYLLYDDHRGMTHGDSWSLTFYLFPAEITPAILSDDQFSYKFSLPILQDFLPGYRSYELHDGKWEFVILGGMVVGKLYQAILRQWDTIPIIEH